MNDLSKAISRHENKILSDHEGDEEGFDRFYESRLKELMEDISEISGVDDNRIVEIVMENYGGRVGPTYIGIALDDYFNELAQKQAMKEFSEKDNE